MAKDIYFSKMAASMSAVFVMELSLGKEAIIKITQLWPQEFGKMELSKFKRELSKLLQGL